MATRNIVRFEERHIQAALALYRSGYGVGLSSGDSAREIARFLERNPGASAVVETPAEALVGAILCGHDGRRGFLYHLAVHPDERGQGLGRALVEYSLDALRAAGIPRVSIHVFAHNVAGASFWAKLGWRVRADLAVQQFELSG
ncbi:MAG TPA: GNAT family N-acetyltransferase [Polyangiaceae bacterium]|jgi:ribosomal protein S18 acetylase RimI-like enzyme|nr:GNAT family N-acetyltransferase [Polyangiaceae bacterium]